MMEDDQRNETEAHDPIFEKVDKTLLKEKGLSIQYQLVETSEKLSLLAKKDEKFLSIFLGIAALLIVVLFIPFVFIVESLWIKLLFIILPVVFAGSLGWLAYQLAELSFNQVIYFDKTNQLFLKYKNNGQHKNQIKWNDLHTLQIIKRNEKSFEMNLVTKEVKRFHLSTYVNTDLLFKDAETISQLVDIPIWMEGMEGLEMLKTK